MYTQFYGLKEKPFNVTSDPSFLFFSRTHREAFSHLLYGIKERKGFIAITGEIGAGKTTLCRAILNQLDSSDTKTAFIFNPSLSGIQLLEAILEDFGLTPERRNKIALFKQLNKFLLSELSLGRNIVLIIDEAQNIRNPLLEEIRMLSNLETEKEKLFQIILVGQPQLNEKLNSAALCQLRQRIVVRFHVSPLGTDEIEKYIYHRLKVAGSNGDIKFTQESIRRIFAYSNGIPRLINLVCDRSLLKGYAMGTKTLDDEIVKIGISEIEK
ncbi:MAG: AAA family ATPase [Candidatus Omnitrophica bacterium]|nr:AAA family ATPase [Candidatus Omnitrophota bacterium]